jgi:fructan beta-fructosidase
MRCIVFSLYFFLCLAPVSFGAEPDLLIADFEEDSYGTWRATGEAFGNGPARGTLDRQMQVSGFLGHGLVNSYSLGDGTTGTLTSPRLAIERPYICFLIGGGMHPGRTCIDLLVGDQVVRTATGPNDRPGGSEQLDWHTWDVRDLMGQQAVIRIVDEERGGWGHINIDQILQSNERRGSAPAERQLVVEKRYLHLPVRNGASKCWMRLLAEGACLREFDIELAEGTPDFWVFVDMQDWAGKTLTVAVDRLPYGSQGLAAIVQADTLPDAATIYREALRPQFHFTTRRGWHNDPNGLVYYRGEYHLFYQHNPYGTPWGNMTWGHAVSKDLVHWVEGPDAIHPDALGTIFSGSAVVDWDNTAGWKAGDEPALVCFYTSAGSHARPPVPFTQSIAYSNDGGHTWTKYARNPVLANIVGSNRDPKVFWHAPTRKWVMALFLDGEQFALFDSTDLKEWKRLCDIPVLSGSECPDMFELPIDGDVNNRRWVFWAANGNYLLGTFDGQSFVKESGPHVSKYGLNDYAAQTYSDIPAADGRRIQISWMAGGKYPGMPFNQQMTVPRVLTLRNTEDGVRLFLEPVKELECLRGKQHSFHAARLEPGVNALERISGEVPDLLDIEADIDVGAAQQIAWNIRGQKVEYSAADQQLTALGAKAPLPLDGGHLRLRILVDRTSVEVFAGRGRLSMATCFVPDAGNRSLSLTVAGGTATAAQLDVWEMASIWQQ